ncbi:hypothetical protein [Yoonia sp. BS5-3]|uniref:Uncharacterized protein n=1 Tax=Yoonia phaeophyticola TaxID=3137369 RepID=A0ABZ2V6B8_9RHOB
MLSYSFDIYQSSRTNGSRKATAATTSHDDDQDGDLIAIFRDQETADAVTSSPAVVRLFLEETGFGFSAPTGNPPAGYVRANNAVARRNLKSRIAKALSNNALERALDRAAADSSFDVRAFILSVVRVRKGIEPQQKTPRPAPAVQTRSEDAIVMPTDTATRVIPRRPGELQGRGIKSRLRPQQLHQKHA